MSITLISAMDKTQGIGHQGTLPWHLPPDLKHFKQLTMGKTIVMGRKTFESIGKPLSGRENIMLSRRSQDITGCRWVNDPALLLKKEIMVIGGAEIYAYFLPHAQVMELTRIQGTFPAEVFFPAWDEEEWECVSSQPHEYEGLGYTFERWERRCR